MSKLKFKVPGEDADGFVLRLYREIEFFEIQNSEEIGQKEKLDEQLDFLSGFVTEPKTKKAVIEALRHATEKQFSEMLGAVLRRSKDEAEDAVSSGEDSGSGDG